MPHIKIGNLSTNQLSKLRNRHSVRIKPGDALHVNLDDLNYNYAMKKLSKGISKGKSKSKGVSKGNSRRRNMSKRRRR